MKDFVLSHFTLSTQDDSADRNCPYRRYAVGSHVISSAATLEDQNLLLYNNI